MKKILLIILCVIYFPAFANSANKPTENSTNNPKEQSCAQYDNDTTTLKKYPGYYYFRRAICRIDQIHDDKTFNEVADLLNKSVNTHTYPPANFALGMLYLDKYESGKAFYGTKAAPSDLVTAINNYEEAAEYGSAAAANNLGEIYLDGANLNENNRNEEADRKEIKDENAPVQLPDVNKAIYWLTLAAKNGEPAAQGTLSDLYAQGIGMPQDYVLAYVWQNLSVASHLRFNARSQDYIWKHAAETEKNLRDRIYNQLTQEQKNEAQNLLKEYTKNYFKEPNELDKACLDLQSYIAAINIKHLLGQMKKP